MQSENRKKTVLAIAGLAWCSAVTGTYLWANTGYYSEKLSAFGGYAMRLIGGS